MNGRIRYIFSPLVFCVILLLSWEFFPRVLGIKNYVFPTLSSVMKELWFIKYQIPRHLKVTVIESLLGFAMGSSIGMILGILIAEYQIIKRTILPYIVGSNTIPVVAVAPIVVLWFGHGFFSKSVVAAFLCFFPVCVNTARALTEYPSIYSELFQVFGASKWQFFSKFKVNHGIPFVFSGLKLSATFSVIGAIVAEFVGSDAGLGFALLHSSYNLNSPRLYGYLILSCLLGVIMYTIIALFEAAYFCRKGLRRRSG